MSEVGRPTKYKFLDAAKLTIKCVYVFFDGDTPVYVGKTKNMKERFEPYRLLSCHNERLNNWLRSKKSDFYVDVYLVDCIDDLEVSLIKSNKETLFNISNGCEADWFLQNSNQKPWVAGTGILSPISDVIRATKCKDRKQLIKRWLDTLSDKQRCVEEVSIAMMVPMRHKRWLDLTAKKLIACMEAS